MRLPLLCQSHHQYPIARIRARKALSDIGYDINFASALPHSIRQLAHVQSGGDLTTQEPAQSSTLYILSPADHPAEN